MMLSLLPFGVMAAENAEKSLSDLDKWENNISIINSVLKDNLIMAEGSPKFFNNGVAGHYVDGNNTVYPVLRGDTYMIPVRSVAESFGFTCDWDDSAKKVTLKKEEKYGK